MAKAKTKPRLAPQQVVPDPRDQVMTQAEAVPPPEESVPASAAPSPDHTPTQAPADPSILKEVKDLADRVGGVEKLQELVRLLREVRA
jgi:hypothetical protein